MATTARLIGGVLIAIVFASAQTTDVPYDPYCEGPFYYINPFCWGQP